MINIIYYEWRLTLTVVKDSVQNHFLVQNHMTTKAAFKPRFQVRIQKLYSTKPSIWENYSLILSIFVIINKSYGRKWLILGLSDQYEVESNRC